MYHYYYDQSGVIYAKSWQSGPMSCGMAGDCVESTQDLDPGQWQIDLATLELIPRQ